MNKKLNILDELVANKKLPVLFIGSGIPKRYLYKFPSWMELLEMSFNKVKNDPYYLGQYKEQFKRENLPIFDQYQKLGSIIEKDFNTAFFNRQISFGKTAKNPSWVKKGISPYKMYLRHIFSNMKLNKKFDSTEELKELSMLKNKISAVITTNYDTFIEDYILDSSYTVFTRQYEMFSNNSYNISELYKLHGSITDVESIVITEDDYNKFSNSRKLFVAKMLTLFTEAPIIFLGYSFSDRNIQQIVSDFMACLSKNQLSTINKNFIFITYKKGEQKLIETKRIINTSTGEIPITEIETDNYLEVYKTLNQLIPGMTPQNIRNTQRLVKRIVNQTMITGDSSNIIMGIDDLPDELDNSNIAIAIGYRENIINDYGYGLLPDSEIFEDIIYNNKKFDYYKMCTGRLKSTPINKLIPVFKYIKKSKINLEDEPKLQLYVDKHNSFEKLITSTVRKSTKNLPIITSTAEVFTFYDSTNDLNKTFGLILKNYSSFSIKDLKLICKKYYPQQLEILLKSTNFKRVVMCIDLMENYL